MPKLTIDGIVVDAPEGASLVEAAELAGIAIPTLCNVRGMRPLTACMLCVVKDARTGRTRPACAARAEAEMVIETNTPEIREARRAVLQLLLSEHAGDCEAPCRRMCPAGLDVPRMLRLIARGDAAAGARLSLEDLVLPATLGHVCTAPCELACRRGVHDETVAIREMHRRAALAALEANAPTPPLAEDSGKRVAVAGAGPAGLAAAWVVRRHGHACTVYDEAPLPGGSLRKVPEERLPTAVLNAEIGILRRMGIEFRCGETVRPAELRGDHDAVVLADGSTRPDGEGFVAAAEGRLAVASVGAGKAAGAAAHGFLTSAAATARGPLRAHTPSVLGRLNAAETERFVVNRIDAAALARPKVPGDPRAEAQRCLQCDCRAPVSCKLRQYAVEYGAEQRVFRAARQPAAATIQRYDDVLFEPGKCIKCGLCIEVTRDAGAAPGLTFVGRGFDTRVAVPFNESLEAALKSCAEACVRVCPTGALAFAREEEEEPCE